MTDISNRSFNGLEVFDETRFLEKMQRFGAAGLGSVHFVLDFDHTLTLSVATDGSRVSSSWGMLEKHLPPDAQKKCQDMYEYYVVKELDGTLTNDEAVEWWTKALNVQQESRVDLVQVEAQFMEQASIRPGTHELFELLDGADIPSIILSAGVKNVIDIWCAAYGISPSLVVSTELTTDSEGKMNGWNPATMVHALNKDEVDHPEVNRIKQERPYTIVIGDSMHDHRMAAGDDTVIRIRIVDLQPGDDGDQIAQATAEKFDAMLTTSDLLPVVALVKHIKVLSE